MMTEGQLAELERLAHWRPNNVETGIGYVPVNREILVSLVVEVRRLRAENYQMREADNDWRKAVQDVCAERDRLRIEVERIAQVSSVWCERAGGLDIERDRLREALRWYADRANYRDGVPGDLRVMQVATGPWEWWQCDDGSRARKELEGSG
jgi:FtsZ-binding cell division protein ZapB